MIYSSSFYLQLSQANMMLSLGADPPSPVASSCCFIPFAVSRSLHSPFGGRFYTWEGCAAAKPGGSAFCSSLRGGHITAACTPRLLVQISHQIYFLGTFHRAMELTGEKITFIWQLQLHLGVAELVCSREVNPGSRAQKVP